MLSSVVVESEMGNAVGLIISAKRNGKAYRVGRRGT